MFKLNMILKVLMKEITENIKLWLKTKLQIRVFIYKI